MANGKVRAQAHLIEQDAVYIVRNKIPREWVVRELTPDYGIDLDVEIFETEKEQVVTVGEHLFIQVKGTTAPDYQNVTYGSKENECTKKCLKFSLDTAILKLVERMGNALPVLLVVVDTTEEEAYFVCLNDYIDFILKDDTNWRKQAHKTINVPCDNKLEDSKILRWYALRPKLNDFFAQASALASDLQYAGTAKEVIQIVTSFALKNQYVDIWRCSDYGFTFMEHIRQIINNIAFSQHCPEADIAFEMKAVNDLFQIERFDNLSYDMAKNLYTAFFLSQEIENANTLYRSYFRQLFITSECDAIVSL